ncbi:MAG: ASCH domain-containing protein [bacterium]|nr:ASCH domain-containing protein [bacterium]
MNADAEHLWLQYLDQAPDADGARRWLYETCRLGNSPNRADDSSLLVTRGIKTAMGSLLWQFQAQHKPLPQIGSLRILENGRDEAVCVIQTTQLATRPFREVDTRFAYDNGEWDRSLKTWRLEYWQDFSAQCAALGRDAAHTMPIVCERFRIVHQR